MIGIEPRHAALPSRAMPRGTEPLEPLFDLSAVTGDREAPARGGLTEKLASGYAGDLRIPLRTDRPTVVANFVETMDGIVALDRSGRTGGSEVSGFSPTDRFVMGLLRALADVVLVGAATIRSSGRGTWTPAAVYPPAAVEYSALRERLGLPAAPMTLIATSTGDLDPDHPVFVDRGVPVVVAAAAPALARLRARRLPAHVRIEPLDHAGSDGMRDLVDIAGRLGARLVLSEGGPHLLGNLVRAGRLDELFLTLAPQLAGRAAPVDRLALVEGAALWPALPTWARLWSARRAGDHLFLRYRFEETD